MKIGSGMFKRHFLRHKGVKPYVCSQCPNRFYTAHELQSHQLVHSDFKQFCCGKWFKGKYSVKSHFKRCTERLPFNDN